ncbi:MAG: NlpC/P60 family protein [Pedobacter sp.]|nr:MAG: NlpC/P60 family protein [Pedobacter sp.]
MYQFRIYIALLFLILSISSCAVKKSSQSIYAFEKAKKIEETFKELKNKKLPNFIKEWTGTPYKLGGMDKKGIDCSGFALLLQDQIFGVKLVRRSIEQALQIEPKQVDELKEGDLIFFSFSGKDIDHVGVYLNNNYFVHASTTRGVIVDDLRLAAYRNSIVKCGSVLKSNL